MWKVTWRNLLARKVRLLLSAFAIVLGVAFVAGSMIFTDAMGGAFDDIIEGSTADVEVAYEGANDFDAQQDNRTIPASVVDDLEKLPEAASVHPQNVLQTVFVIGKDGKVIGGNGPPGLAFNYSGAESLTGKPIIELTRGDLPDAPYEVALDVDTVEKGGFDLGDTITLATPGTPPTMEVTLTGVVEFGSGGLNGATLTVFDRAFLQQQFFDGKDVYTSISLNAADGVSQQQLADAAQKVLPRRRRRADRRRLRRRQPGLPRRDPRLPRDLPAGLRRGLAGGRHLPDHQHLLDPGRAAQPRAGAAPRPGRLPPPDQPLGGHRGARGRLRRLDGRARGGLPARARAALAVRPVRPRPQPCRVPGHLVDRRLVVRRRAGGDRDRVDPARHPGLPDRADGRAA